MTGKSKPRMVRPIERQPMRDWLFEKLESKEIPGLEWLDRQSKTFRIKWCHGSRHGWSVKDSVLFEQWAIHSGRWNDGDPKRWKANFRCALNSLRHVEEVKDQSIKKGQNAYRVFKMLDTAKADRNKSRKRSREDDDDSDDGCSALSSESTVPLRTSPRVPKPLTARYADDVMSFDYEEYASESEGYQTDVQDNASMDCTLEDTEDISFSAANTLPPSVSPADDTVLNSSAENSDSTNIPNFEKISPGICNFEFGKVHYLPRHNAVFVVDLLKKQDPLTPEINFPCSPPVVSQQTAQNYNASLLLPGTAPIPSSCVTSFSTSVSRGIVNRQQTTVKSVQLIDLPDTPDGSIASSDGSSEDCVQLGPYEGDVTDSTNLLSHSDVVPNMTSSALPSLSTNAFFLADIPSDTDQSVIVVLQNGLYFPLTPP